MPIAITSSLMRSWRLAHGFYQWWNYWCQNGRNCLRMSSMNLYIMHSRRVSHYWRNTTGEQMTLTRTSLLTVSPLSLHCLGSSWHHLSYDLSLGSRYQTGLPQCRLGSRVYRQGYGAFQGTGKCIIYLPHIYMTHLSQFLVYKAEYEANQKKPSVPKSSTSKSGPSKMIYLFILYTTQIKFTA